MSRRLKATLPIESQRGAGPSGPAPLPQFQLTVVFWVSALFDVTTSASNDLTLGLLVMVPATAGDVTLIVMFTIAPIAREPTGLQVTFVKVVVTVVHVPLSVVADTNATPTGSESVKMILVAGIGPLL